MDNSSLKSKKMSSKLISMIAGLALVVGTLAFTEVQPNSANAQVRSAATNPSNNSQPVKKCVDLTKENLEGLPDAPTQILGASVVEASGDTPEYCDIKGYVNDQIQFEMQFPISSWNGKYFQAGCGGFCGTIPINSCAQALDRGYAVAAENMGHVGNTFDALWAYNNRRAEINWGYRSSHVVSIAAKELIKRYYGKKPAVSYFQGCSTGGRQALNEAQRFPNDFDGIISGDPALKQNQLATIAQGYLERVNRDEHGNVILPIDKLPLLSKAVMKVCDNNDGRKDNVIDDPSNCDFDPVTIQCRNNQDASTCLTARQVKVVNAFYDGPTNRHGKSLFPGLARGSELGWGAGQGSIGTDDELSGSGKYATNVLRYLAFKQDPGPNYKLSDFNYKLKSERDKLNYMAKIYNADNPDMKKFRANGGKLLLYHGWADPLITPYQTINYYEDVAAISGGVNKTQKWFRLFLLPGVWHCRGGLGADQVDWLTDIENWVERGQAPQTITARKIEGGKVTQTRSLRPYPALPADQPQSPIRARFNSDSAKVGDRVVDKAVVTNTGSRTLGKVTVTFYPAKHLSGHNGKRVFKQIHWLTPGETATVKATYRAKSAGKVSQKVRANAYGKVLAETHANNLIIKPAKR